MATIPARRPRSRPHPRGAGRRVTLVEYGDFQCPYCGDAYPVVKELLERFDWLRLRVPPHAARRPAPARAGRRRGRRGRRRRRARFWEMHDRLFENQHALSDDALREHAAALGLDLERFDRELREGVHRARVEEDYSQRRPQRHPEHAEVLRQRRDPPGLGQRAGAAAGGRGGVRGGVPAEAALDRRGARRLRAVRLDRQGRAARHTTRSQPGSPRSSRCSTAPATSTARATAAAC